MEIWKDIPSEPHYQVSDLGRVRSKTRKIGSGARGTRTVPGKILRPGRMGSGHQSVMCGRASGSRTVHTLVLEAFVGPCPPGCESLHGDGDPANNRLGNLRWGTRSENLKDLTRHGGRKLTLEQAAEIRRRYVFRCPENGGWVLAREFGVCASEISNIVKKRHYVA